MIGSSPWFFVLNSIGQFRGNDYQNNCLFEAGKGFIKENSFSSIILSMIVKELFII